MAETQALALGSGSLGPFSLGAGVNDVLRLLQRDPAFSGEALSVVYEDASAAAAAVAGGGGRDVQIDLENRGFRLRFDDLGAQVLRVIDVYDLTRLRVRLRSVEMGGNDALCAFGVVYKLLGPTYPGTFDAHGNYLLSYPGVTFSFAVPAEYRELYRGETIPMEFPDGTAPAVQRIVVYDAARTMQDALVPVHAALVAANMDDDVGWTDVRLSRVAETGVLTTNVCFPLHSGRPEDRPDPAQQQQQQQQLPTQLGSLKEGDGSKSSPSTTGKASAPRARLRLGMHAQEVLQELGAPSAHHLPNQVSGMHLECESDSCGTRVYFWNYNHWGLDVGLHVSSHTVLRIVLHANHPGHPDFGLYQRAPFRVHMSYKSAAAAPEQQQQQEEEQEKQTQEGGGEEGGADGGEEAKEGEGGEHKEGAQRRGGGEDDLLAACRFTYASSWSDLGDTLRAVKEVVRGREPDVVQSAERSSAVRAASSSAHPFGNSIYQVVYSHGAILECLESGRINTIILFDPAT